MRTIHTSSGDFLLAEMYKRKPLPEERLAIAVIFRAAADLEYFSRYGSYNSRVELAKLLMWLREESELRGGFIWWLNLACIHDEGKFNKYLQLFRSHIKTNFPGYRIPIASL